MSRVVEVQDATLNLFQLIEEILVSEEEIVLSRDGAPYGSDAGMRRRQVRGAP